MRPDDTRHGTRFGYRDDRCKCDACKKAIALDHNLYKMRVTANGGAPLTVDKCGAVRRLQGLMALGWPRRELSRRAGYAGDAFALILYGRRQRLELATDRRIRNLYDQLSMTPGPSSSSRIRAAKKGWAHPLAWDDDTIDDPTAEPRGMGYMPRYLNDNRIANEYDPAVVERILGGDFRVPATSAERRAVVARWPGTHNELEAFTGWRVERYTERESA